MECMVKTLPSNAGDASLILVQETIVTHVMGDGQNSF